MMKSAPTWIPNSKGNRLLLGYRFPKEIGSNVDADIPDKEIGSNMDTGIPQGNRLQYGYRNPARKSAPNWIPESRNRLQIGYWNPARKSAPNWIPESRKKSAPNWIPESRKKWAPNWIPESRK
ncbi:hypothetical protein RIR_jg20992.t1 [Rhizophagus irregularis DAOM 181602=DAOM 197198]|nr:hypothetical protein RIR_jg20992.t1 [Rhizophagus irregularis DAOM 181602=DAOM 197198]